jgi:AraC-like DNA-binding protein
MNSRNATTNTTATKPHNPAASTTRPVDCGSTCLPNWLDDIGARLENRLARRAFEEFRAHPTNFVSVGEWAAHVGVSREHLTRSISPVINPHALILATRLALSMARLARQDTLRAGEALDLMGYSSRAHAFMVFKNQTGLTPSEWWRRYRSRPSGSGACLLDRCPLLSALLDRAHEKPTRASERVEGSRTASRPSRRDENPIENLVEEPVGA